MKRTCKVLSLILAILLTLATFVGCSSREKDRDREDKLAPASEPEEAEEMLQRNGYIVNRVEGIDGEPTTLTAVNTDGEGISITWYESVADAKEAYNEMKEENDVSGSDYVVGRAGSMVWYATSEKAVEAASKLLDEDDGTTSVTDDDTTTSNDDTTKPGADDEDESGNRIGVQWGTTGECFLNGDAACGWDGYDNVDVKSYDSGALAVNALLNGELDYVMIDAAVAKSLAASYDGLKVIDYELAPENFGIGVDKNQPALLDQINEILENRADDIAAIYAKYDGVNDENSASWMGTTVSSAAYDPDRQDAQLVVATNAAFAPYEFTVDGAYAGIDMELAQLIADALGMELVIVDMAFEEVVPSVGKNGIDVLISGLTINPARQEMVNFTEPYEKGSYQVIIALEDDDTFDGCMSASQVLSVLESLGK